MSSRLAHVALVAILGVTALPHVAWADAFQDTYDRAVDLFNLGKYEDARLAFEKARAMKPNVPGPHRFLARVAKRQERWADCQASATRAIEIKPDSTQAEAVRDDLRVCREKLGRPVATVKFAAGQGGLAVVANVEGASVLVDGIRKGGTPLSPVPINVGPHVVRVEAVGHLPVETQITVIETITVDAVVDLPVDPDYKKPVAEGDPDAQASKILVGWLDLSVDGPSKADVTILLDGKAPTYAPDGTIEAAPGEHVLTVTAPGWEGVQKTVLVARAQKRALPVFLRSLAKLRRARTLGYVSIGIAAAAAASGFVLTQLASDKDELANDYLDQERTRPAGVTVGPGVPESTVRLRGEIAGLRDDADSLGKLSLISFGIAAVAVGVSVYFFLEAREPAREALPLGGRLTPTVMTDSSGAAVGAGLSWSQELP